MATVEDGIRELSEEEWWELLEENARRYLNMSADEFVNAWNEGKFHGKADNEAVLRVAFLLPLAGK